MDSASPTNGILGQLDRLLLAEIAASRRQAPLMVDAGRLRAILERAETDLARLRELASTPPELLIHELDRLDAVKYRFGTAIEGLIDAAHHLISSERLRAPSTYAEAFVVLGEAGFLDHELAGTAQEIARFRNLLVHGYAEVDDERVIGLLATRLGDLDALRTALARAGSR